MILKSCPLGRYKKIILATDGSQASQEAIEVAFGLAETCGSFLYIVSVVEIYPITGRLPIMQEKLEQDVYDFLIPIEKQAKERNIHCKILVLSAQQPYEAIINLAEKESADTIVVGTHGRTGLKTILLGSVSKRIIGHASCPVWLIPPKTKFSLDHILLATDGSENSNIALEEALRAAQVCQSILTVVSVVKPALPYEYWQDAERIIQGAKKKASARNIPVEGLILEGEPWEKIVEFAKKKDVNVIMMGRHGQTGLKKLLVGSVTERVAGHSPCSVVVVPS